MRAAESIPFRPLRYYDGYLPIEDYGLIGDSTTCALIARDGAVVWLCVPRFDSDPLLCRLLDRERGGAFVIAPLQPRASRQRYVDDSGVLQTEIASASGVIRVTDALPLAAGADLGEDVPHGRGELLRVVEVLEGRVQLLIELAPRGPICARAAGSGLRIRCERVPGADLTLACSHPLAGMRTVVELRTGERLWAALRWAPGVRSRAPLDPDALLDNTTSAWRRWAAGIHYHGPERDLVRRSAITLKMLDYSANGAMVAAATSSLPEAIGGERNWDYRYAWIRDAAFSVYALRRIGLHREGDTFLSWVLNIVEVGERPRVLYDLDGRAPPPEREDPDLEGYLRSAPVRWGNAAADQRQHDVYGEILDCAYQWSRRERAPELPLWEALRACIEGARREWSQPDHGIWEVRTPGRPFTYSAALCQVALDRGARLAQRFGLGGDVQGWQAEAERVRQAILDHAWDPALNSLTEHLGGGALDASLLTLPLRRVVPATHPKMIATTAAIQRRLGAGSGLLFRYLPDESPDGIAGHEGAFLLCSFWLVDNLAQQGRLDEAVDLYHSLCRRAGPLGLLPEQIDPATGAFLGNYPQAFSHVGVISSGIILARLLPDKRWR